MEVKTNVMLEMERQNHAASAPSPVALHESYPPAAQVVVNQPLPNVVVNPMAASVAQLPLPPGLEYLSMVDQLIINQTVEMLEVFSGFETANKYKVKNSVGQMVFLAREESGCCARNCCGNLRKFEMRIVDMTSRQAIHLKRPFACQSCCFPCCLQKLEVCAPPGVVVGYVEQNWNPLFPSFSIKNSSDDVVLNIKGPLCTSSCCCSDVKFKVMSANGSVKVGKIYKQWSGVVKEMMTDADNFVITFPLDLDVRIKAVLLAACFLIDMMYFESSDSKNSLQLQNANGAPTVRHQMSEEKTIVVTLESGGGGQPLNPVITTQPAHPGYGPPQGNHPNAYGNQPVVNPPQSGYGVGPPAQGGYGPPPNPGYGMPTQQPNYPQPSQPNYPPNSQPNYPPVSQPGYGIPPTPQQGPGIAPPGAGYGIQPPPGLEYLTTIDTLIVNQIFNVADAFSDREPENEFIVANSIGQKVYYAKEESDDCSRRMCGSRRAFRMKVFDNFGNQIIDISRPIACQACCFPCCMQKMEVSAPPGTVVGLIHQEWALLYPTFAIKGPTGDTILRIQGPWCTMNCYADVEFKVLTSDGANEVGKISKRWSGYSNENSAKMDVFGISFPMDLDVRMKAVMLGACFLIDMMYFEQGVTNPNKSNARAQQTTNAPQHHQELKPI
ncbi:hypothetical protein FQR65_LT15035 [Abscondita terminalis]|nr:hypothetical protein FQR65_LT15035 [Abscondita terminalis]